MEGIQKDNKWYMDTRKILFGNVIALMISGVIIMYPIGIAGVIDIPQMLCVVVLMSGIGLVIQQLTRIKLLHRSTYEYKRCAGVVSGVCVMLLTIAYYCIINEEMQSIHWKISLISFFWGNLCNGLYISIKEGYIQKVWEQFKRFRAYQYLRKEKKLRKSMDILWNAMQEQQDEEQEQKLQMEARSMRHDMKNQMRVLQTMLQREEHEKAQEYLQKMYGKLEEITVKEELCKNEMVNILLNHTRTECKKNRVIFSVTVCNDIPEVMNMDLCVLLGNALDNAIEGCTGNHPKIMIDIRRMKSYLLIEIKNTIRESVLNKNPNLKTTKKEASAHGIGLSSMRNIVEKYDGSLTLEEEKGYFICSMLLRTDAE